MPSRTVTFCLTHVAATPPKSRQKDNIWLHEYRGEFTTRGRFAFQTERAELSLIWRCKHQYGEREESKSGAIMQRQNHDKGVVYRPIRQAGLTTFVTLGAEHK
ncbi:hypothetical protein J6590_034062 [Homalodisca vitripennis]|nr:hypothetical protein J6590_034062 [Homalodisca vitripennis]